MIEQDWQGGKTDGRQYHQVRKAKMEDVAKRYEILKPFLNERSRRLWAANEAIAFGKGGVRAVSEALGKSGNTVIAGIRELEAGSNALGDGQIPAERQRRRGGGRKSMAETKPEVVKAIEAIVDPATRGDPMMPLRWVSKSRKNIKKELDKQGHVVSKDTIGKILKETLSYSLQGLRKTREGTSHPDRDTQFHHINEQCRVFQADDQPVISVDTKKKELVGDFKNAGREWRPQGQPEPVRTHDFVDKELGKAAPYGVYDIAKNEGWVSVGCTSDTAEFAVHSIRMWWYRMGQSVYPQAKRLLITADAGGSNGYRVRLWKWELQKLADETGLTITVCHLPPGTSKWNKIEHRMFCHITENWRGRPLTSLETIVELIAGTTTEPGLTIKSALDATTYRKGIAVSDAEMDEINITKNKFRGEWNYSIAPACR